MNPSEASIIKVLTSTASMLSEGIGVPITILAQLKEDRLMCITPKAQGDEDGRGIVDVLLNAALRVGMEELGHIGTFLYLSTRLADWVREESVAEDQRNERKAEAVEVTNNIIKGMKND
jgi:hypothetical protein